MNKQSKALWVAVTVGFFSANLLAAAIPRASLYDGRMQQVDYNAANTTVINARLGFLTTVVFDPEERIIKAKSGFESGWEISTEGNKVYISARPAAQEQDVVNSDGDIEKVTKLYEPTTAEWQTNLFITSSKRDYSVELNLIDEKNKKTQPAFVLNYSYPDEKQKQANLAEIARLKAQEKNTIALKLEAGTAARNWDYFMVQGKESQLITPDFAYDDGVMTYIGFSTSKTFPAVFLYANGKEQVLPFSTEQKGNFKVMVLHTLSPRVVLRHGEQVVGVVNKSFGKVPVAYQTTRSAQVERVEVSHD